MRKIENINVRGIEQIISPVELKREQPLDEAAAETVVEAREVVKHILDGSDPRLLVIVGPCSIHDERMALEYAGRLSKLAPQVKERLFVLLRVFFRKTAQDGRLERADQRSASGRHI